MRTFLLVILSFTSISPGFSVNEEYFREQKTISIFFMKMNIAVVYSEPSKVWVTTGRELQVSDDNGYTGILVGGIFNFNISNSDLLYIASQDYNGAFTQNGGKTWKYCNASGHGWGGFTYGAYAASENVLVTMVSPGWHEPGVLTISKNGGNSFAKTNLVCNGLETGCAIRKGDWKLMVHYEDQRIELFNLAGDPGEETDVAKQFPEKVDELKVLLDKKLEETGANV
jgi:hypothetical protein